MPLIYKYFGLIFYFWSDEHLPAHVHVADDARTKESIFDLIIENSILLEIRTRTGTKPPLKPEDINKAKAFIQIYYPQIVKKWFQYYICGEQLKTVTIRKRVSGEIEIEDTLQHLEALKTKFHSKRQKQEKNQRKK